MLSTVAFLTSLLLLAVAAVLFRKAHIVSSSGQVCRHCGYPLRTSSTECPECGTVDPYDHRVLEHRSLRLQVAATLLVVTAFLLDLLLFLGIFIP